MGVVAPGIEKSTDKQIFDTFTIENGLRLIKRNL